MLVVGSADLLDVALCLQVLERTPDGDCQRYAAKQVRCRESWRSTVKKNNDITGSMHPRKFTGVIKLPTLGGSNNANVW